MNSFMDPDWLNKNKITEGESVGYELSVAWTRGYLHYWHGNRPNEYEEDSIEYADWQTGFDDAADEEYLDTAEEDLDD